MNVALRDQKKFAARASWYYYKTGMTQGEIAKRLGINRARVINIMNEVVKKISLNLNYSYLVIAKTTMLNNKYTIIKETLLGDFKRIK